MRFPREFIKPNYNGGGIANIPPTILRILDCPGLEDKNPLYRRYYDGYSEDVDKVILFVFDSLGYNVFSKFLRRNREFKRMFENCTIDKLTSVFPATTATAITTLSTGRTPQEHGIMGYKVYLREFGAIVNMIKFSALQQQGSNRLLDLGVNPKEFLGLKTIYELLNENNIKSFILLNRAYSGSGLSKLVNTGGETEDYATITDMMVRARKLLERNANRKTYIYMYWEGLDTISHMRTPFSEEAEMEILTVMTAMKRALIDPLKKRIAKRTVIIITGDHGQSYVDRKGLYVVNEDQELTRLLMIPPTGETRIAYLYPVSGAIDDVKNYFYDNFGDNYVLIESKEALKIGLFGLGEIKSEVLPRIGELIVLPRPGYGIKYFFEKKEIEIEEKRGSHGGMSKDEQLVTLIVSTLKELQE